MYKKQQQFVSCTICDHDEMKCYWSPMHGWYDSSCPASQHVGL